jgi:diamine N-acetyltransferase
MVEPPGSTAPLVELRDVDAANWRDVAEVAPAPEQGRWVAPVTRYLCLCVYDGLWQPLAMLVDGRVVGFAMWAFDTDEGTHWIGGLVVDASHQGRGIGRGAMLALLAMFEGIEGYREAALSVDADNVLARGLYHRLGFVETGEEVDGEAVMRRPRVALGG